MNKISLLIPGGRATRFSYSYTPAYVYTRRCARKIYIVNNTKQNINSGMHGYTTLAKSNMRAIQLHAGGGLKNSFPYYRVIYVGEATQKYDLLKFFVTIWLLVNISIHALLCGEIIHWKITFNKIILILTSDKYFSPPSIYTASLHTHTRALLSVQYWMIISSRVSPINPCFSARTPRGSVKFWWVCNRGLGEGGNCQRRFKNIYIRIRRIYTGRVFRERNSNSLGRKSAFYYF